MAYDFPTSPTPGQISNGYIWNGQAWIGNASIAVAALPSDSPPTDPVNGQLWWESDTAKLFMWYVDANSGQWVQISGTASIAADGGGLPEAPSDGAGYLRSNLDWTKGVKLTGDTMTGNLLVAPAAGNAEVTVKTAGTAAVVSLGQSPDGSGYVWTNGHSWRFQPDGYLTTEALYVGGVGTFTGDVTVNKAYPALTLYYGGVYQWRFMCSNDAHLYLGQPGDNKFLFATNGYIWSSAYGYLQDYVWSVANERAGAWANARVEGMRWTGGGDYGWSNNAWGAGNSGNVITGIHWAAVGSALVDAIRVRYLQYYRTDTGYVTVGDG